MNRSILWLPLDIPKLNLDREKVLEYFFERRTIHQQWAWVYFKVWEQKIDPDLEKIFPGLDEKLRQLPFKDYDNELHIDFRQQIVEIWPHHDPVTKSYGSADLGPTAYKNMVVRDKLETFYLLPQSTNPDVFHYDRRPLHEHKEVIYPVFPDDTDWWCLNNHEGYHGSRINRDENDKNTPTLDEEIKSLVLNKKQEIIKSKDKEYKVPSDMKITMFFSGPLDIEKHLELIKRSKKKYEDYVIYN